MAPEDPLIGQTLGNFRIERVLGRGGMAVVYYALDLQLERPAAVKVIDARYRDNPVYAKRFLQEARTIATLRHENILQVYYADVQDDLYFFAMEYIDGQNLAEILVSYTQDGETLPQPQTLYIGKAIASALDYAHAKGVIHRDVKPSNVLVTPDGRVLLGDFGLALDVQQGSLGEAFGTAHYIAPEQARSSNQAGPRSDLYSLGVMLYEMMTGVVPFDDPSPASLALQHISMPPPSPRLVNPELSEAVEDVLLKALSKDPQDRYATGTKLLAALEKALSPSAPAATAPVLEIPPRPREMEVAENIQSGGDNAGGKSSRRGVMTIAAGATGCGILSLVLVLTLGFLFWRGRLANLSATQEPSDFMAELETTASYIPRETTPTETITITPFQSTPTRTPTRTFSPTQTSTSSPSPSQTPTRLPPTSTATPTKTATLGPTPTWTPQYAGGRHMVLLWNESSFYMLQVSGKNDLIHPLTFERVESNGLVSDRFSANIWGELHASTRSNWCMRLEIGAPSPDHLHPDECNDKYLASSWPNPGDSTIFWTQKEDSSYFQALWRGEVVQRCEIASGSCEIYIP